MITTSQAWKDSIYNTTEKKIQFTIGNTTLTDDDIQGKVEIQETCTNTEDIKIGSCIASILKFNVTNKGQGIDFLNNDISVQAGMKIPSTGEYEFVPMGIFLVDTIDDKDERVFKVTCRDRMKLFDKDCTEFLATRTYPITLWNLTQQLCAYVGIEIENTSILNENYLVDDNFAAMNVTGQQILSWIGEVAASFININRYGKLVLKTFTAVTNDITDRDYINITAAKYPVPQITRLQVAVQEDDLGVIVGSGNITYTIINNPLLYTKSETQVTPAMNNILSRLQSVPIYTPTKLYGKGNPAIETGDIISVSTVKGQMIDVLVMDRKFVYQKSFRDTYESFGTVSVGEKRIVQSNVIQLKGKMNILSRTLEKNVLKVADLEIGYNEISQTVDQLSIEVSELELEGIASYYQEETPEEPKQGDVWYNPGHDYRVDNLTMTVDEMTMTVDELTFAQSTLKRYNGTEWQDIKDTEILQNIANLTVRADEIEGKVTAVEGNVGELQLTATSLTGRITSAEGNIGELQLTSNQFGVRLTDAEGNIGELQLTSTNLLLRVQNAELDIDNLQLNVSNLTTNIGTLSGRIDSIDLDIGGLKLATGAAKLEFNSDGLTIKNGGFKILQGSTIMFQILSSGMLYLRGEFRTGLVTLRNDRLTFQYATTWEGAPDGAQLYIDGGYLTIDNLGTVMARNIRLRTSYCRIEMNYRDLYLYYDRDFYINGSIYTKKRFSSVLQNDYVLVTATA